MDVLDYYDWAILGDQPAVFCSAIELSRLGYSVIHIPFSISAHSRVSERGQFFDPENSTIHGLSLGQPQNSFFSQYFSDLKILESLKPFLSKKALERQVIQPGHRIKISQDSQAFRLELLKEFGVQFLEKFPLDQLLEQAHLEYEKTWLESYTQSEKFTGENFDKKILDALFLCVSKNKSLAPLIKKQKIKELELFYKFPELLSFLSAALFSGFGKWEEDPELPYAILGLLNSTHCSLFNGGQTAFRRFLQEKAKTSGVSCFSHMHTDRLFVNDGKIIGFQETATGKMIGLGGVFYSGALDHLPQVLHFSGKQNIEILKKSPIPVGWKFTMAFTLNKEALPAHLPRIGLWKERNAPPIEYEILEPKDYGYHLGEDYFLFARTLLPFEKKSLDSHFQQTLSARIFRQLREVFPFIEYHIKNIFPDFRNGLRGERNDFFEANPYRELIEIPENIRSYQKNGTGYLSGVKNLYLCSQEAYPSLGEFGPYFSYLMAIKEHRRLK